jgi:hypothetical protein
MCQLKIKGELMKYGPFSKILLIVVLAIVLSGCGQIASDSNFTLTGGETVSGSLLILSQNAILAEGTSVDGSVVMLCCNLTVKGDVNGNVFLLTGNIDVQSSADVKGQVSILTGNVSK